MNRRLWNSRSFEGQSPSQYPCPKCYIGILKEFFLEKKITKEAIFLDAHSYPYGIKYIFSGMYRCSEASCDNLVSFGGYLEKDIEVPDELPNGQMDTKYITIYKPKYFYPNLRMFELPTEISDDLKEQIDLSFSHYFNDLSSCANRIRAAIEVILNEINAPNYHMPIENSRCPIRSNSCSRHRTTTSRKRKKFITLNQRIEHYKKKNKELGTFLLANKTIGNEGSHIGKVEVDDILDAYEILEEVIDIAFVKNRNRVIGIAKEIITLKKPRSKK